ncbi:MAG: hypothetical protein K2X69_00560 [Silvanigrellaceae bacterium]|nr:hypothetical protein [Silvanigrellaceae bacterium]
MELIQHFKSNIDSSNVNTKSKEKGKTRIEKAIDDNFFNLAWYLFLEKDATIDVNRKIRLLQNSSSSFRLVPDIISRKLRGVTPLHCAINKDKAKNILSYGPDINAKDNHNLSPLFYMTVQNKSDIAYLLSEHGARLTEYEQNLLNQINSNKK